MRTAFCELQRLSYISQAADKSSLDGLVTEEQRRGVYIHMELSHGRDTNASVRVSLNS